jgi:hypothetical protein
MNAESTVFRSSRPAVVVAPGGEGVRAAALVLALPLRLAGTPLGRRLLAGVVLAAVLVTSVGFLYDSADAPRAAGSFRPAGLTGEGSAGGDRRQATASPARPKRALGAAEVAAAWFAARQKVALDQVRALQQRRISATEVKVLVVAESAGSRMPSQYVTVRKGSSGWRVR